VAVRDHFRALRQPDQLADPPRFVRPPGTGEEPLDVKVPRAGDVALPRVARVAATAAELVLAADVDDRQRLVVEAVAQLLPGRHRTQPGLEAHLRLLELHRALLELAGPGGDPARQHRDAGVAREQRGLRRGGGPDTVAPVVEHEPLLPGDAVAAEAPLHLDGELLDRLAGRERRRRAEHERDRPRQVAAPVRVRAAHVADQQVVLAEVLLQPGSVDERRQLRHRRGTGPARR
jgi:hypothetical protein